MNPRRLRPAILSIIYDDKGRLCFPNITLWCLVPWLDKFPLITFGHRYEKGYNFKSLASPSSGVQSELEGHVIFLKMIHLHHLKV